VFGSNCWTDAVLIDQAVDRVIAVVERWASNEDRSLNGGRLICRTPWIAPEAFLHRLYPPNSPELIASIAPATGRQPPRDFARLLERFNGADLFGGSLSIYGVRTSYDREADIANWQPFDVDIHQFGLSDIIGRDGMVIGSVGPDVDPVAIRSTEGDVARFNQKSRAVLETWPSLAEFLTSETDRYAQCYAPDGHLLPVLPEMKGKVPPWPEINWAAIKPRFGSRVWWRDQKEKFGF
jgi:hypothetical protein